MADEQRKRGKTTVSRVVALEGDVASLKSGHAEHHAAIAELRRNYCVISKDISEIKAAQMHAATKLDLQESVNGVLRDALEAVPGKHANIIAERSEKIERRRYWVAFTGLIVAVIVCAATVLSVIR